MLSAFGIGVVATRSGRFLIAFVFLLAGFSKLLNPEAFRTSARTLLPLTVPGWLTALVAGLIPVIEVATGLSLIVVPGAWPLAVSAGLLISFEIVLVRAWRSRLDVSCNCFGSSHHYPIGGVDLLRTGLILALCLALLFFGNVDTHIVSATANVGLNLLSGATAALALTAGALALAVARLLTVVESTIRKGLHA